MEDSVVQTHHIMKVLRQEMERSRLLLDLVHKREKLKRRIAYVIIDSCNLQILEAFGKG